MGDANDTARGVIDARLDRCGATSRRCGAESQSAGSCRRVGRPLLLQKEFELPLRMLFVGDYMGSDERPIEDRIPIRVDKDTFSKVLAAHSPRLDLVVSSATGSAVRATLTFRQLSDFGPDALASQIPEARRLLAVRDALTTLKNTGDVATFRKHIEGLMDAPARQCLLSSLGIETS